MDAKNHPDPAALAVAKAMQELMPSAQVILNGSRAVGQHRPDSDVDLMAVFGDAASRILADEALSLLLPSYDDGPQVHVHTIVRAEFEWLALMAHPSLGRQSGMALRRRASPWTTGRSGHHRRRNSGMAPSSGGSWA